MNDSSDVQAVFPGAQVLEMECPDLLDLYMGCLMARYGHVSARERANEMIAALGDVRELLHQDPRQRERPRTEAIACVQWAMRQVQLIVEAQFGRQAGEVAAPMTPLPPPSPTYPGAVSAPVVASEAPSAPSWTPQSQYEADWLASWGEPVPLVLICPRCNGTHVDRQGDACVPLGSCAAGLNHQCEYCGQVWHPRNFATVGERRNVIGVAVTRETQGFIGDMTARVPPNQHREDCPVYPQWVDGAWSQASPHCVWPLSVCVYEDEWRASWQAFGLEPPAPVSVDPEFPWDPAGAPR